MPLLAEECTVQQAIDEAAAVAIGADRETLAGWRQNRPSATRATRSLKFGQGGPCLVSDGVPCAIAGPSLWHPGLRLTNIKPE